SVSQYLWLYWDKGTPVGDGIPYILKGMRLSYILSDFGFLDFIRTMFRFDTQQWYPPFGEAAYFIFYSLFGVASEMELMMNALFFMIGMLGVFGLGCILFNGRTGLLASFLFATMPGVLFYSKMGMREYPLMCFFAPTLFFYYRSNLFTEKKYAYLYGIGIGVLLWIKLEILIFLILPTLLEVIDILWHKKYRTAQGRRSINNFIVAHIFALIVACPWYIKNHSHLLSHLKSRIRPDNPTPLLFSTEQIGYYITALFRELMTLPQTVILALIVVAMMVRRMFDRGVHAFYFKLGVLVLTIILPMVIFTLLEPKDTSHLLPGLPIMAVIIAGSICSLRIQWIGLLLACYLLLHGVNTHYVQFFLHRNDRLAHIPISMYMDPIDKHMYTHLHYRGEYSQFGKLLGVRYNAKDSSLYTTLSFIYEDALQNEFVDVQDHKPRVLLLANWEPLRFHQVEYYNLKSGDKLDIISPIFTDNFNMAHAEKYYLGRQADYIIVEHPAHFQYGKEDENVKRLVDFINENEANFADIYKHVESFNIRWRVNSEIRVYKRIAVS
ncbi:MAG: glycosyltransferase family 39 protein, partial [Candidatus Omnitrophica bacterium]|nr:glycosyltransferase family 39 protein [Candidatus Omnitrophota bacterium]